MGFDFDEMVDRKGTNSIKWEHMDLLDKDAPPDTLPFWVADMDFACAPPILEALRRRTERRIFGYSSLDEEAYKAAVIQWYASRHGWGVDPADLFYSPGVVPAIAFLLGLLTGKGDGVIIQRPVYYPFSLMIERHGRRIVNNPLRNQGGRWEMDFEDLEAKAKDPGTKLLILCSPHNPVGRVWTEAELRRLGTICLENGLTIVADEIHGDLVRAGQRHLPLAGLFPEAKGRIITTTSPSKTFNMAGLQLSNIVISAPELRAQWSRYVADELGLGIPNSFSIPATIAAYTEGGPWLDALLAYLDGNFALMEEFHRARFPFAPFRAPEGTYLAWSDFRAAGLKEAGLVSAFCHGGKVLVEGGSMFGPEGEGFVRMNAACPRSQLAEGLERMAAVLKR